MTTVIRWTAVFIFGFIGATLADGLRCYAEGRHIPSENGVLTMAMIMPLAIVYVFLNDVHRSRQDAKIKELEKNRKYASEQRG